MLGTCFLVGKAVDLGEEAGVLSSWRHDFVSIPSHLLQGLGSEAVCVAYNT